MRDAPVYIYMSLHLTAQNCTGNMAFHVDSPGTSLIVCQYLERSIRILRSDLCEKIQLLLSNEAVTGERSNGASDSDKTNQPAKDKTILPIEPASGTAHAANDANTVQV